jgi:hypothetical protein
MIGRAFSSYSHQNLQRWQLKPSGVVGSEVAFERPEDFQALRIWVDYNLSLWFRFRYRFWVISAVTRSKTCRWQVPSCRWLECKWFTRWRCKGIRHRVEGKLPSITHGGDNGRGGEEVHGLDVSVVPRAEIPVEGGEDGYEVIQCQIRRVR